MYSTGIERDMDLLDILNFAAAPRNSNAREEILIARIEMACLLHDCGVVAL